MIVKINYQGESYTVENFYSPQYISKTHWPPNGAALSLISHLRLLKKQEFP